MFTGIVEAMGMVQAITDEGTNRSFWVESPLSSSFSIDQSVAHDGVCLTVEAVSANRHRVTAVAETLAKTTLGHWQTGQVVNLEQSLLPSKRLDGHFVQGHVDTTALCEAATDKNGSWEFRFRFPEAFAALVIEKGSISLNGISLTVFNVTKDTFCVAVIPYTFAHTNLRQLKTGNPVNLEFDMLGKYLLRRLSLSA